MPFRSNDVPGGDFGLFPLNSSVSFYSYFNGNILFLTLALLIALDRDIKPLPEPIHWQADATGLQ